ncbi:MAG: hypothetical protein ACI9O3_000996 [Colwellia sp.]|uniref:hypothetical protein n=1 Tax=unclassified Colwellia TaxID=196834 RepID=UPI001C713769|nr:MULTISPECIES: hypothetical protein [unclassified Colwellia]
MFINEKYNLSSTRRNPWIYISVIVLIFIFIGFAVTLMPKAFKMTHEQIGTGLPALVFIYDPNLVVSISQTEQMNKARDQLGVQVLFLIAKIRTPEGDQFIAEYQASPAELLLFDPSGRLIKRQFALRNSSELTEWITVDEL